MTGSPTLQIGSGAISSRTTSTDIGLPLMGEFSYNQALGQTSNQIKYQSAGVISNLGVRITSNTISAQSTLNLNVNSVDKTQTVPITASTPGYYEDTTHTDSIAVADLVNVHLLGGATGTNIQASLLSSQFTATTNTVTELYHSTAFPPTFSTVATYYLPIAGGLNTSEIPQTTETFQKTRMKHAGIIKNLTVRHTLTSCTGTAFVRQNGSNTGMTVATTSSSGVFNDTTHTATVAVDDDLNYSYATSTAGTVSAVLYWLSTEFETTTGYGTTVAGWPTGLAQVDATTQYHPLGGRFITNTTESVAQSIVRSSFTFSNLGFMQSVSDTPTGNLRLRKNTANGNQTITSTASTTGYYQDTTNTDVTAVGDIVDYSMVASSVSGSHNVTYTIIKMDSLLVSTVTISQTIFIEWEES